MTNTAPQSTAEMVFANKTAENQIDALLSGRYPFPESGKTALCFYGTYGTGKTTYAHIFCREFELKKSGEEIEISPKLVSCQKTESIREILKTCTAQAKYVSCNASSLHYFIFDEVDNLTDDAQRALKAFLNTPNIVCVLTTNYLDKLDKGMLSRCVKVNFNAADPKAIRARTQQILRDNGRYLDTDEIDEIIRNSDGSWREIVPMALMLAEPTTHPPSSTLRIVK
ncbi:ATP-binding protein [Ruegeria conchae]|uniref:ATP-binding protein n=1 Tax=Ruegeria conchae TaxID=981384 RepID=UPI00148042D9|nr:ATP-binding protein [Ruegeria conchae]UWR04219.1 ATP-binding protein [Ruegeria conchae]